MVCTSRGLVLNGVISDLEKGDLSLKVKDADVPKSIITAIKQDFEDLNAVANRNSLIGYKFVKPLEAGTPTKTVFTSYYKNREVYLPHSIVKTTIGQDEFFIVGDLYWQPSVFNKEGKFIGKLGIYSSTDKLKSIYGSNAIAINSTGDKIAIASLRSDTVEIYELAFNGETLTLGDKVGRVGVWRSAGHPSDGKLSDPMGLIWLENGNLLIGCHYGYTKVGDNLIHRNGHISEFQTDGTFVKTHLGNLTDGKAWNGEIDSVSAMKQQGEYLFVSSYADYIAVYKITDNTLSYVTTITNDSDAGSVDPRGVCLRGNKLYITLGGVAQVAIVDMDSLKMVGVIGHRVWDDRADAINGLNDFWDIIDIEYIGDDKFLVCDKGNKRVAIMDIHENEEILYDMPNNIKNIIYSSAEINEHNKAVVRKGSVVEDIFICYEKKEA